MDREEEVVNVQTSTLPPRSYFSGGGCLPPYTHKSNRETHTVAIVSEIVMAGSARSWEGNSPGKIATGGNNGPNL